MSKFESVEIVEMKPSDARVMFPTFFSFLRSLKRPRIVSNSGRSTARAVTSKSVLGKSRVMPLHAIEGALRCEEAGRYRVNEELFAVDSGTWVVGSLVSGAMARVELAPSVGVETLRIAKKVVILDG